MYLGYVKDAFGNHPFSKLHYPTRCNAYATSIVFLGLTVQLVVSNNTCVPILTLLIALLMY